MTDATQRRAPRVGVDVPVLVTVGAATRFFSPPSHIETVPIPPELAGTRLDGRIVNLSPNGAFVYLDAKIPPLLARVEIDFELDGFGLVNVAALVMRRVNNAPAQLSRPQGQSLPGIGVLFTDMSLEARQAVSAFVWKNRRAGRRVLVVEDSPTTRKLIADALRQLGATETVEVSEASSGVEALRLIEQQGFDIVVSDMIMPELDGFKLISHLRTSAAHKDTPIMAISGDPAPDTKRRALELGANAFLHKPLQKAELYRVVRDLLGV